MKKRISVLLLLMMICSTMQGFATSEPTIDFGANAPAGTFLAKGEKPVSDQNSYKSENLSIVITKERVDNSDLTIAEIYVRELKYLRRAFASGHWKGSSERIEDVASQNKAILALSGDFSSNLTAGLIVANGEVLQKKANQKREGCIIYQNGEMATYKGGKIQIKEEIEKGIWQSFLFGPALLKDGKALTDKEIKSGVKPRNPRSAIGYVTPGHYYFVLVDGRTAESRGLKLDVLAKFMEELGCEVAYNLDGGQSAVMYFQGQVISNPYHGGRKLADIVYVGEQE